MGQSIKNQGDISHQINVSENRGEIVLGGRTRLFSRFKRLKDEVASNDRYEGVKDALKYYLTKLDGIDMTTKLQDAGFTEAEVIKATRRKDKYAKQLEKNRFYESAQLIDSELFAKLIIEFETHVEIPLIQEGANKLEVAQAVLEKVITPTIQLINNEGEHDSFLNYTHEDLYGMLYYLTGKCHINWANHDSL